MTAKRTLLRYFGGKWLLAPWIISHFPKHRIYTEAFGGAGSVLLRKKRCYSEVFNDLDEEIVNLFMVVRDHGERLQRLLHYTPYSRQEFVHSYIKTDDPVEQARRTVVRSFMGFGSNSHTRSTGFRSDANRNGTTPAGDWKNYPEALESIIDRLRGVCIEKRDAETVMLKNDTDTTLHYADPPYPKSTRGIDRDDYNHEMTDEEHEQLSATLHSLKGMVVLSGYRCEMYDDLYKDWHLVQKKAHADGAKERVECLWINPLCWSRQQQMRLFD